MLKKEQELFTSSFTNEGEPEDGDLNVEETNQNVIFTNDQGVMEDGETGQQQK